MHASMDFLDTYCGHMPSTNSDPTAIASYFLGTIEEQGGCPLLVRGDRGTKNVCVATMQKIFPTGADDALNGSRSFNYS